MTRNNVAGLLTRPEAAKYIRVSLSTLDKLINQGFVSKGRRGIYPTIKMGQKRLIRTSTLEDFLERPECHA